MIKLNIEESLSNLSLLNSTVTETTTLINEQFNVVGSNINSALSSNITNAINMFLLLEQSCLNSSTNMYNTFATSLNSIDSQLINTQIISDTAFLSLSNNAISYMSAAFDTISNGMISLNTSMAVDFMNIGVNSMSTANLLYSSFLAAFTMIGAQMIAIDLLFSGILANIDKNFFETANNSQQYFQITTASIKSNLETIKASSIDTTTESGTGWEGFKERVANLKDKSIEYIGVMADLKTAFGNVTDGGKNLTQILNINTGVQTTNTIATAAAGSTASSASLSVLSFGGGVLAMGAGVLLAGMALALLAKTVFNFLKMSGISTNGVKASDFDLSFSVPGLATGGFPSMGQMFIAREAGPELVGTIGGRNAVVNNNQIVESVSAGVYKAVREAMGSGNRGDKIVMTLDKKVLGEATIGYINGKTRQTGVTPILV